MQITLNNQTLNLTKIGRGAFARVYKDVDSNDVYSFILMDKKNVDYSKEAMALWIDEDSPHIPQIEVIGNEVYVPRIGYCNIYKMPLYNKCPNGNKVVNRLIAIYKEISNSTAYYKKALNCWYSASLMLIEEINKDDVIPQTIKDAIESIYDSTNNYGMYGLEFCKRNIMQDNNGNIILLDIVFNPKALR